MAGTQDFIMPESTEAKLEAILNAINTLSVRTTTIEGVIGGLQQHQSPANLEGGALPVIRQDPPPQWKEPRVSLPEKFDGTRSKFRGFVNQIRLIIALQSQRYPTEESRVGLIGTLLTGQALSWFAPLFEKGSPILNNFDTFLEAFAEAFGEHDKARWATTKIRSLRQGTRSASAYASDFRQLACDINWDEAALMSQFYWSLKDSVKDLLLSLPDPQTLNEAISQAVKCDNRLFQRRQDQSSWTPSREQTTRQTSSILASSPSSHLEVADMQIDAIRVKHLTPEEKKRRMEEGLCLYCGEGGHRVPNCPKKPNQRIIKTRATIVQENEDAQPQ